MLEALMVVAGFVTIPFAYPGHMQTAPIYNTTPYEDFEVCQGHLRNRGEEIAKLLLPSDTVTITLDEKESVLVVEGKKGPNGTPSRITLMCKEL